MFLIVWKLVYSVLLTMIVIASLVFIVYYVMFLFSVLTGLIGMYTVSEWFREKAEGVKRRVSKVFDIALRRK